VAAVKEEANEQLAALRAKLAQPAEPGPNPALVRLAEDNGCTCDTDPSACGEPSHQEFGTSADVNWQRELWKNFPQDENGMPLCQLCNKGIYGHGIIQGDRVAHVAPCPTADESATYAARALSGPYDSDLQKAAAAQLEKDWDSTEPRPEDVIQIDPADVSVYTPTGRQPGADNGLTIRVGDGITVRVNRDGVIRVRAEHHDLVVNWVTNKPRNGDRSVVGIKLTRKDE
jgi:hypothetical protein